MKLHLPKSLRLSLLSALSLATPFALTLGSTAWGGWGKTDENGVTQDADTYYLDSVTTSSISSVGLDFANYFIRTNNVADYKTATVNTLELGAGHTMNIDGSWDDDSKEFECLTLENIEVAAGESKLHVSADNVVMLNSVSGDGVLNLSVDGEVSFGPNFNSSLGTVTNNATNNNVGIINIASDFAGTFNGAISNRGVVVLQQGNSNIALNDLIDKTAGKYNPSAIANTSTGNLVIENTGNKTLSSAITIANGGTVTLKGGTFGTAEAAITYNIVSENNTTIAFEDIEAYIGGGSQAAPWKIGSGATVHLTGSDTLSWGTDLNLTILTGGVLDLEKRQSVKKESSIILAGGTITGTGSNDVDGDSQYYGFDFFSGGKITTTENSRIETNIGGHLNAAIEFDVDANKTLTMTGNLVGTTTNSFTKSDAGIMVYSGAEFEQALTISGGVFEYNFSGNREHTGSISGTGTLRKSGDGTLTLSSANTTVANLAVTRGKMIYNVTEGEKSHTLTGTGGSFEKTGEGVLHLGAMNDYAYTGSLIVTEGKVKFAGTSGAESADEDVEETPSFVTLITNLTTADNAEVEIADNVLLYYQGDTAAQNVINIDDNITITGKLEINSWGNTTAPDSDGMRRWNVLEGANLNVGGHLWLTNKQKMVVSGGELKADGGIKLGHAESNADGNYCSKFIVESGSVTTTGVTFSGGENDVVMSGGELTFTPTTDGAQVLSAGSGVNRFTVTGGTLKATDASWALTGTDAHVVSLGNATFDIAAEKTITLSGSINLTGSMAVEGAGTLQVGDTTWNVATSDLGNFFMHGVVADEAQTNGLGSRYYSFITGNVVQQDNTASTITVDGENVTLKQNDGAWIFGGISDGDFIINGTFSTTEATEANGAVGADVFVVNKGGIFTIDGNIAGGKIVKQLLTTTLGGGEIKLTTNATLDHNENVIFGGTLAIAAGNTLTVGDNEADVIDLSTLREIRLDGGGIYYNAKAGEVKHLNVTADSLLHIFDMNTDTMTIGKVSVAENAALTVNSLESDGRYVAWNHKLNIGLLTGDGSVVFNGPGDPSSQGKNESTVSTLVINSLDGFTGDLTVSSRESGSNSNELKKGYSVTIKTGDEGANFNKLDISGFNLQKCTFVVQGDSTVNILNAANGTVNLEQDVTLTLGDGVSETTHSIGTVSSTISGTIHLNKGATLNAFTKGSGSGAITLTGSGVYDLGNAQTTYNTGSTDNQNVNGNGNFTLASGWTGTVRIEGAVHQTNKLGLNLHNISNANSAVELINVNGWFTDTMAGKLILTEDEAGNAAWTISNGSSEKGGTSKTMSTFNGAVSGNGTMKYAWSVAQNNEATYTGFKFNGDISDWEGAFVMDVNNSLTNFNFVLGTDASEVNAAIGKSENNTGKLHLKVECTDTTTFNNTVEVDTLTTSTGAVHFNEDVTVEDTVTTGGILHVEDGTFVAHGSLNATGKTVELSGSYSNNAGTEGKSTAKLRLEGEGNKVGTFDFGKSGYARGVLELGGESDTTAGALFMNKDVSISMEKGAQLTVGSSSDAASATTSMTAVGDSAGISIDNDTTATNTRGQFIHNNNTKYVLRGMDVAINYSEALTSKYRYNNSSVSNIGSAKLTLDNAANALTGLKAVGGDIDVLNKESMSLQELKVATSLTVGAYTGSGADSDKTGITVMECVEFGASATLNANLTVATGATVTLNGYGETAAMVDGNLTFHSGLTLAGSVMDALEAMQAGDSLAIFREVSAMMFAGNTSEAAIMTLSESALTEVDASIYFSNLAAGNYMLVFNEVEQTVSIQATIPEPTTATLSLLALAALAARRRRAVAKASA